MLVIGGAGYVGSHACKAFAASGWTVTVFDNQFRILHLNTVAAGLPGGVGINAAVTDTGTITLSALCTTDRIAPRRRNGTRPQCDASPGNLVGRCRQRRKGDGRLAGARAIAALSKPRSQANARFARRF